MFRWGILSTAIIAREKMIPAIHSSTNGVVAAIASLHPGRAEEAARRFAIPHVFSSYEALLESDVIDGVYVPVPTSHHTEWAIKAAEAGKHVLCEKPIAMRAEDIDRLIETRNRTGVMISEAFMVTYHPQWRKVRSLVQEGRIGRLRHVQGAFSYRNMDPDSTRNRPDMGGGALPDIGVYPTVTTRFVTGAEPARVSATVVRDPAFGTDTYSSVRAEFEGFELSFYCSTQMALRQNMVFHGETGFIEVHGPFNAGDYDDMWISLHNEEHDQEQVFRFPGVDQYRLEAEAFVSAIGKPETEIFDLENSRANQKVIDAIFRAGQTETWEAV